MKYDIVVIGAGPGGYVAAIKAAQLGLSVAVIEREHLGGICLNWGCIPTKTLLKSSEINHLLHNIEEFGFSVDNIKFDLDKIIKRSRAVSVQLSSGIQHLLKKNNIPHIKGEAKFLSKDKIEVLNNEKKEEIEAKNFIIATGARAKSIPGFEGDGKLIWTYKEAMTPDILPKKLLVVGSGAIGAEFASFYQNMGSKVTLLEVMDRILISEDEEIAAIAHKSFIKQGIEIFTSSNLGKFEKGKDDVTVTFKANGKTYIEKYDRVIMAVGITANIENIGLENTKVTINKNNIKTNEFSKTDEDNIYAIGDVAGAPWLAHKASHEAIIAVEKIAGHNPHPLMRENIPGCTYTRPQIASIGLSEKNAREAGFDIKIGRFPFIGNGKAIAMGETEGLVKTIYDAKTGELIGAHLIGAEVTELIQGFALVKKLEGTELDVMHTVFAHPTLSEMIHESTLGAFGKAIHI